MNCLKIQKVLSPYLDRELEPSVAAEVENHLRSCTQCREALNELRLLVREAEDLAPATLTADLWPAIERQVSIPPASAPGQHRRPAPLSEWRPRIAWALAVASIFLAIFFLRHQIYSPRPTLPAAPDRAQLLTDAKTDIELARSHYENSMTALEQIVAHRTHDMDQDRSRLYREKLAHLEDVIDECSIALEKNSYDVRAQRALFDAYDRKISTLREMAVSAAY